MKTKSFLLTFGLFSEADRSLLGSGARVLFPVLLLLSSHLSHAEEKVMDESKIYPQEPPENQLICIRGSDKPYTGMVRSFWPNKGKKKEYAVKDGKRVGTYLEWYENGKKQTELFYKDGKLEGLQSVYHENGKKSEQGFYKDGKRHGSCTVWYENGKKQLTGDFKNDKREGTWVGYNKDGLFEGRGIFKDGKLIEEFSFPE